MGSDAVFEQEDDTFRCWCGDEGRWDEMCSDDMDESCGGTGTLHCTCGGDICVCHNHGEVQCDGCEDCEEDWEFDEDYYPPDDEDWEGYEPVPDRFARRQVASTDPRRKRDQNKRRGGRLLSRKERWQR